MNEPVWIHERVVVAAHLRLLAEYGSRRRGVDDQRLARALMWPREVYRSASGVRCEDVAAAYAEAVMKERPFDEGNARTAYLLMVLFLRLNDRQLPATNQEKLSVFSAMCRGLVSRKALAEWMTMRQVAFENGADTVVRLRVRGKKVVGVTILNDNKPLPDVLNALKVIRPK